MALPRVAPWRAALDATSRDAEAAEAGGHKRAHRPQPPEPPEWSTLRSETPGEAACLCRHVASRGCLAGDDQGLTYVGVGFVAAGLGWKTFRAADDVAVAGGVTAEVAMGAITVQGAMAAQAARERWVQLLHIAALGSGAAACPLVAPSFKNCLARRAATYREIAARGQGAGSSASIAGDGPPSSHLFGTPDTPSSFSCYKSPAAGRAVPLRAEPLLFRLERRRRRLPYREDWPPSGARVATQRGAHCASGRPRPRALGGKKARSKRGGATACTFARDAPSWQPRCVVMTSSPFKREGLKATFT